MSNLATAPVASAFNLLQTLLPPAVQAATFKRRTGSTYSTSTGIDTPTYAADLAVQASVQDYSRHERADAAIQPEDRKALIQGAQLASDPAIGDKLVVGAESFDVVGIRVDPARVVFTLQIRKAPAT